MNRLLVCLLAAQGVAIFCASASLAQGVANPPSPGLVRTPQNLLELPAAASPSMPVAPLVPAKPLPPATLAPKSLPARMLSPAPLLSAPPAGPKAPVPLTPPPVAGGTASPPLPPGGIAANAGKAVLPPATPPAPYPAKTMPQPADARPQPGMAGGKQPDMKNEALLFEPVHLQDTSLMFSKSDMAIILSAFSLYDSGHSDSANDAKAKPVKDDLNSLLNSLKSHETAPTAEAPPPLPNLYLGSIVYYAPNHWTIWVNGRKLTQANNASRNALRVSRISPADVDLLWRPASLQDIPALWQKRTEGGAHPLPGIALKDSDQTLLLHMRPNQTFLPKSLSIHEGLVLSPPPAPAVPGAAEADAPFDPAHPMPPMQNRLQSPDLQLKNISGANANLR